MLPIERLAQVHDHVSYTRLLCTVMTTVISRLQRGHHVLDVVPMRNLFMPGEIGHLHPHTELIINCIGHGSLQLLDGEFAIRPETLVLTPRGVAHFESPSDGRELYANIILGCSHHRFGSHIRITEPHTIKMSTAISGSALCLRMHACIAVRVISMRPALHMAISMAKRMPCAVA